MASIVDVHLCGAYRDRKGGKEQPKTAHATTVSCLLHHELLLARWLLAQGKAMQYPSCAMRAFCLSMLRSLAGRNCRESWLCSAIFLYVGLGVIEVVVCRVRRDPRLEKDFGP